jgi:hypothetical protein
MKGWVYVTSNLALPGLVKIGFSSKDPKARAVELDLAGLPHPHVVEYEVLVEGPRLIEQQVHARLESCRHRKEFFECDVATAVAAIREIVSGGAILEESRTSVTPLLLGRQGDADLEVVYYENLKMTFWSDQSGRSGGVHGKLSASDIRALIGPPKAGHG